MKTKWLLLMLVLAACVVDAQAVIWAWKGDIVNYTDQRWENPALWNLGTLPTYNPGSGDWVLIREKIPAVPQPIIDGINAYGTIIYISKTDNSANDKNGILTINSGTLTAEHLKIGYEDSLVSTATVNVNGGLVTINGHISIGEAGGVGTLNVTGGKLVAHYLIGNWNDQGGTARANISGGEVWITHAGNLTTIPGLFSNSVVDITGSGKLVYAWDVRAEVQAYIDAHKIITSEVGKMLKVDYNETNPGWTTIQVIPEPATMALLALGGLALLRRK